MCKCEYEMAFEVMKEKEVISEKPRLFGLIKTGTVKATVHHIEEYRVPVTKKEAETLMNDIESRTVVWNILFRREGIEDPGTVTNVRIQKKEAA